jgi:hypothetical protein
MPFLNVNDPAYWGGMYDPPFIRANRFALFGEGMRDARNLRLALEAVGMQPTHRVALIGGAYGWVAEEWISAGYQWVGVFDISAHVHANKSVNAVVTIHNESGETNNSKGNIRQALGRNRNQKIDWAVTEDLLPMYTDAEINSYAPHLRDLANNVAHWVTPLAPGSFMEMNWKTMAAWKAMMTPDSVIERGKATVY